jgi:5-methylcytosine-specific restriction endonuclease McrA
MYSHPGGAVCDAESGMDDRGSVQKNRDRMREYQRMKRATDPEWAEKQKLANKRWRERNQERVKKHEATRAIKACRGKKHDAHVKEYYRQLLIKHDAHVKAFIIERTRSKAREYMREKYRTDPRHRAISKAWKAANPEKVKRYRVNEKRRIVGHAWNHNAHVKCWRRLIGSNINKKHEAHVKAFDAVATASMQARRYKARGEPWKNPRLSDALKYKIKYRMSLEFRLKEINRQTHRKETLLKRNDRTANFWVLLRERKTCPYCGNPITEENAVADHMDPLKLGGANSSHNLTICCRSCNQAKRDKPFTIWLDALPEQRRRAARRWYRRKHGAWPEEKHRQPGFVLEFSG